MRGSALSWSMIHAQNIVTVTHQWTQTVATGPVRQCRSYDIGCYLDSHPSQAPAIAAVLALIGVIITVFVTSRSTMRQLRESTEREGRDREAIRRQIGEGIEQINSERLRSERSNRLGAKITMDATAGYLFRAADELKSADWMDALIGGRIIATITLYERQFSVYPPSAFLDAQDFILITEAQALLSVSIADLQKLSVSVIAGEGGEANASHLSISLHARAEKIKQSAISLRVELDGI